MRLGMIGLETMGLNMTRRLLHEAHEVAAYDLDGRAVGDAVPEGAEGAASPDETVEALEPPRRNLVMVPAGLPTRPTIERLVPRHKTFGGFRAAIAAP